MTMVFKALGLIPVLFLFWSGIAPAESPLRLEPLPREIRQGDIVPLRLTTGIPFQSLYGDFRGTKVPLLPGSQPGTFNAFLGIDLELRPGAYPLRWVGIDGQGRVFSKTQTVRVKKADFPTQSLSLPPSMVELDPPTLERVEREAQRLQELFRLTREEKLWQGTFLRPVAGEVTSDFGLRRIINGRVHRPHSGVDLKADAGTPVLASNRGIVALVDHLFFSGISVILDHGWGLYSMYFHLSESLVRPGEVISKGTVLGRVGSTGRSTAPHLHWGIRIQGARVNPFSLLRSTQSLGESPRGSNDPIGLWRFALRDPQNEGESIPCGRARGSDRERIKSEDPWEWKGS